MISSIEEYQQLMETLSTSDVSLEDVHSLYQYAKKCRPNNHKELADITKRYALVLSNEDLNEAYKFASEYLFHIFFDTNLHTDEVFFSFRSIQEYSLKDLEDRTLSMVHPSAFNDPMDTLFLNWLQYRIDVAKDEREKVVLCLFKRAADHIRVRSLVRVDKIEDVSPLMWAHYADFHKGFCVRYRIKPGKVVFHKDANSFMRIGTVDYSHSGINLSNPLSVSDALLWKAEFWNYENESRLIYYDPLSSDAVHVAKDFNPEAIYFGIRCKDEDIQKIKLLLSNSPVEFYKMSIDNENVDKLTAHRIG